MTKINKDAVYVLKQPTHAIASIVVVEGDKLPLTEQVHENLDKLNELSDIIFVFSDRLKHDIDMRKFSMLYRACAFTCGSGKIVGDPLVNVISYTQEVFSGKYCTYLITSIDRLDREISLNNVVEFSLAGVNRPILEIDRLTAEELSEIYMFPEDSPASAAGSLPFQRLMSVVFSQGLNEDRSNSTHKSKTPIIFISGTTMKNLIDNTPRDYLKTFVEEDYSFFIASLIRKLGIKEISSDILTMTVGKLVEETLEEGK